MNEKQPAQYAGNKIWIGVDIGGTKTAIVLCSQPPGVLARVEFPTIPEQGPDRAVDLMLKTIHQLIREYGIGPGELQAIGVSCGGPLDRVTGVIQTPPNLPTWVDVPIRSILEGEFDVPCRLENDANAGAVAAHRFGDG